MFVLPWITYGPLALAVLSKILFHPGRARPEEAVLWADRPGLRSSTAQNRDREAELLCSEAFGKLLASVRGND